MFTMADVDAWTRDRDKLEERNIHVMNSIRAIPTYETITVLATANKALLAEYEENNYQIARLSSLIVSTLMTMHESVPEE